MIRRIRQWWCGRQHDKGYRLHAWMLLYDGKGSIRCRRCGHVREGLSWSLPDQVNADALMAEKLEKARAEGWLDA